MAKGGRARGALLDGAVDGAAVTPNSGADLADAARGIVVTVAGVVRMTLVNMTDGTYLDLPLADSVVHPYQVKRIWASGTTATGIFALY